MQTPQHLPPLLALRAFEAVARHLSFSKAARELCVSQSAISHQVHKLEQHLGQPLFVRRTRAIDLSTAGATYYQQIQPALEQIAAATRSLLAAEPPRVLRVGLLASFATLWLAPRLADFSRRHPEIQLELQPAIDLADVTGAEVDLAIRYGKGNWPKVEARRFLAEQLSPVCSPEFKARALANGTLLMARSHRPFEWDDWSRQNRLDLGTHPSVMLHDYNIVVEAAVAGQGIAMGRRQLIRRHLAQGSLVDAFDLPSLRSPDIGYWLVTAEGAANPSAECFARWLMEQGLMEQGRDT
ncbi:LysR substrate-binding domain-containing protein [Pseudomonas sp. Au-Pse12]|uniref:LysR substrate-binding domain-containing protein n=1 Tax=Pseudomonas sp. Au-Pse12 TaxID=2906459 RepID=UPI001E4BCAF9|nr:LysR substrate-binding domain-containing protein [Pseudomonas sp. Au-Pse12]MCE4053383.1 LysR substrate-binding domain-containing protein [Pseudomonas sp. Au-Pse12]